MAKEMNISAVDIDDVTIEELDEISGADSCAGTATTVSTPISTAACIGCASFAAPSGVAPGQ